MLFKATFYVIGLIVRFFAVGFGLALGFGLGANVVFSIF